MLQALDLHMFYTCCLERYIYAKQSGYVLSYTGKLCALHVDSWRYAYIAMLWTHLVVLYAVLNVDQAHHIELLGYFDSPVSDYF